MWQWFRAKFDSLFVLSTTSIGSSQSPSVRGGNSRKSQEIKSLKRKTKYKWSWKYNNLSNNSTVHELVVAVHTFINVAVIQQRYMLYHIDA